MTCKMLIKCMSDISYPEKREINKAVPSDTKAPVLDLNLLLTYRTSNIYINEMTLVLPLHISLQ